MSSCQNDFYQSRIKPSAHWLFENFYPALFWLGLMVNMAILIFEEEMSEHSCVSEDNHYFRDLGKQLFWMIFLTRLVVLPLIAKLLKKNCQSTSTGKHVSRIEVESNDGLETGVFVFETLKNAGIPLGLGVVTALPAVWPIFGAFYKFYDPRFSRGPKSTYDQYKGKYKRNTFVFMESVYNALSLSSAMSFVLALLFNVFYNSTHSKSSPSQNYVVWPIIIASGLFGGASVFGKKTWKVMNYAEAFINVFYYSFNMSVSTVNCLDPDSFTDSGFIETGWIYVAILSAACLGLAVVGGFHGAENPYENEDKDGHNGYAEISGDSGSGSEGGLPETFGDRSSIQLDSA